MWWVGVLLFTHLKKKLEVIQDLAVQSYIYMTKINKITWIANLSLFMVVVFMGIKQTERGIEIAKLEDGLEQLILSKQQLTDVIFASNKSLDNEENLLSLGFIKPTTVYYFNTEDSFAKLPVR